MMYFATPTELDILNNGKNHIFILFHGSKDRSAKVSPVNKGYQISTWSTREWFLLQKMSVTQAKFKNKKSSKEISSRILGSS